MNRSTWVAALCLLPGIAGCAWPLLREPADPHIQYVINCDIFDQDFRRVKKFKGWQCAFLDDGSWVQVDDVPRAVTRFDRFGLRLWSRPLNAHHMMNLTLDHKGVLLAVAEVHPEGGLRVKYDAFLMLDMETGQTLHRWSSYENQKEFFKLGGNSHVSKVDKQEEDAIAFGYDYEWTHFNSIYEIPETPLATKLPAFAKGNFLVNLPYSHHIAVLDRDMKRILWTDSQSDDLRDVHDVQIRKHGEILLYNNDHEWPDGTHSLLLEVLDPLTRTVRWEFPKAGSPRMLTGNMGGVQWLGDRVLFNLNSEEQGGLVYMIDESGKTIWTRKSPRTCQAKNSPRTQPCPLFNVKEYDLSRFLRQNQS